MGSIAGAISIARASRKIGEYVGLRNKRPARRDGGANADENSINSKPCQHASTRHQAAKTSRPAIPDIARRHLLSPLMSEISCIKRRVSCILAAFSAFLLNSRAEKQQIADKTKLPSRAIYR